jgi:hypothetical protein
MRILSRRQEGQQRVAHLLVRPFDTSLTCLFSSACAFATPALVSPVLHQQLLSSAQVRVILRQVSSLRGAIG